MQLLIARRLRLFLVAAAAVRASAASARRRLAGLSRGRRFWLDDSRRARRQGLRGDEPQR